MIRYDPAPDIQKRLVEIAGKLGFDHDFSRVAAMRSYGSKSRYTLARCHAMPRIIQKAMGAKGFYVIEVISHRFDKLNKEEQDKTLIHELMHIPKSFGGGFRHHDHVSGHNVDRMYKKYKS